MKYAKNVVLYSTNTKIANFLSKRYFHKHYVWCSPVLDPRILGKGDIRSNIPPSSSPKYIYYDLCGAIDNNDTHNKKITDNKVGLENAARNKEKNGDISSADLAIILDIITNAPIMDFEPIVYVIIEEKVDKRIKTVSVNKRANPLGEKYMLEDLDPSEFDEIYLRN